MGQALQLFTTDSISLEEFERVVRSTANSKCEKFFLSFGIFKHPNGKQESSVLLVYTVKDRSRSHTINLEAKNLRDALNQVNQVLNHL